jgi:AmpD protein
VAEPSQGSLAGGAHGPSADWLADARRLPSPHCDERPQGTRIELAVIHCISLPPGATGTADIEALFAGRLDCGRHPAFAALRGLRVSSHLLVARSGALLQFVPFGRRAWHAGRSSWRGREACNDFSVGIELEGCEFAPFTPAQYEGLALALRALRQRLPIVAACGHSDIAPGRKRDPGPYFDWARVSIGCAGLQVPEA